MVHRPLRRDPPVSRAGERGHGVFLGGERSGLRLAPVELVPTPGTGDLTGRGRARAALLAGALGPVLGELRAVTAGILARDRAPGPGQKIARVHLTPWLLVPPGLL